MITLNNGRELIRIDKWQDVLDLPGYTEIVDPATVRLKDIIGNYVERDPVLCGLSTCRQPHGRGYLVVAEDGRVTNIGHVCGKNTFSVEFQAMANRFNQTLPFGATGQLSAVNKTLADYGASILALNATQTQSAKDTLDWRQAMFQTLKTKAASISAVNLDEETANMVLLQNAYAASARVISTTADLFTVLMGISR